MTTEKFKIGKTYTGEQIRKALGPGSYMQVVVLSDKKDVLCIRFRTDLNPKWKTKNELWIHEGERRIPDAQKWIESKAVVPVFCGKDRTNSWTYQGEASASLIAVGEAAAVYTSKKNVGLVLQMDFKPVRSATVKVIRREKATSPANKKKAA